MSRLVRPSVGSAHALAFVALAFALGGGYAVAQSGSAPQPTTAYHLDRDSPYRIKDGSSTLVSQLVIPAPGSYAANAKLVITKARGSAFRAGSVTCFLGAIGKQDHGRVTLAPGESATMALQAAGSAAAPLSGDTQAEDLYCQGSTKSAYTVSAVRMTAITLDAFRDQ